MLHHASLEVAPETVSEAVRFWSIVGFHRIEEPEPLTGSVVWLESSATQIHLLVVPDPVVPGRGHTAIIVSDLRTTTERLREAGFAVEAKRELWGAPRSGTVAPGGHLVELMETAP